MCSMTPNWPVSKKGTRFARTFWNDTSGVILPYVTARSPEWMRLAVPLKNPRAILWVQPHECGAPTAHGSIREATSRRLLIIDLQRCCLVEALDYALGDARPDTSRVFI